MGFIYDAEHLGPWGGVRIGQINPVHITCTGAVSTQPPETPAASLCSLSPHPLPPLGTPPSSPPHPSAARLSGAWVSHYLWEDSCVIPGQAVPEGWTSGAPRGAAGQQEPQGWPVQGLAPHGPDHGVSEMQGGRQTGQQKPRAEVP